MSRDGAIWNYNVFYLSRDHDIEVILSHHPAKFGVHRPYGTGNNGVCNNNSDSNSISNSNAEVPMPRFANGHPLGISKKIENLPISSSLHKNDMPNVLHYNTVYFLRYTQPRYMKCLFTNIQKQYMLKSSQQDIVFIWSRTYSEIFKSTLVHL